MPTPCPTSPPWTVWHHPTPTPVEVCWAPPQFLFPLGPSSQSPVVGLPHLSRPHSQGPVATKCFGLPCPAPPLSERAGSQAVVGHKLHRFGHLLESSLLKCSGSGTRKLNAFGLKDGQMYLSPSPHSLLSLIPRGNVGLQSLSSQATEQQAGPPQLRGEWQGQPVLWEGRPAASAPSLGLYVRTDWTIRPLFSCHTNVTTRGFIPK